MSNWEPKPDLSIPTRDEFVAAALREAILRGDIPPGEKLDQNSIAQQFNVSRSPVREALRTLAAEGLIDLQAHRTARVATLDVHELEEIYDIRQVLEGLAARRAATRISPAQLQRLETLLAAMDEAQSRRAWLDLNNRFHAEIYAASDNARLQSMIAGIRNAASPYIRRYIAVAEQLELARQQHRQILAALRDADGELAERTIMAHIAVSSVFVLDYLRRKDTAVV